MMTAMAVARDRELGVKSNEITQMNVDKITRYAGEKRFEDMVTRLGRKWGPALAASFGKDPVHRAAQAK